MMKLYRHSHESIFQELGMPDFPQQIQAQAFQSVENKAILPIQHTQRFQINGTWLLAKHQHIPIINGEFFSDLHCCNIFQMSQKPSQIAPFRMGVFHIGKCQAQIPILYLSEFLIQADIIQTYVHMDSEMVLKMIDQRICHVKGSHTYYTNCQNTDAFSFLIEWTADNDILIQHLS